MLWDSCWYLVDRYSFADPDPHGSASNWKVGSGSASKRYAGSGSASICRRAYLSTFLRFWAFIWKLGSRSGFAFASKWKVGIGSGSASKLQSAGFGSAPLDTLDRHNEIYTFKINFISRSMCAVWTGWKRTSWNRFGWWIPRRWTPSSITISTGTFFIPCSRDLGLVLHNSLYPDSEFGYIL